MAPDDNEVTFSELDQLSDLDPVNLTDNNLDRLIHGMRLYRANALPKGKATKFSDVADRPAVDIHKFAPKLGLTRIIGDKPRRPK